MPRTPVLQGLRLRLRPLEPGDVPALEAIRAEPEVQRWWGDVQPGDFDEPAHGDLLAIEVDGELAGLIQYEEIPEPMYRSAGVDLFVGARWQGRGLGREAVALLTAHLFDALGHHRLTIDPAAANERAIRCYEAVGFRRVGIMRQYERSPDGTWRDALLMDLLAADA
jgi:aminoglycoside 6'-N-acetyltransferase